MHPIFQKTFAGLAPQYYFRQMFFGLLILALIAFAVTRSPRAVPMATWLYLTASCLLYPYARFVYESIVSFIVGENVFFGSAVLMLGAKLVTMLMCWTLSIFIAPVGLLYLYFHHSRAQR